ncbi:MAG: hypothetical protein GC145_15715 [Caulobacter sp.]|nr:hypothetical protein [Caulobacter sp.]
MSPAKLTLVLTAGLIAGAAPLCALAATPPPAIGAAVREEVVAAAIEGLTPEEANDPSVVPPFMKKAPSAMFRKVDLNGDKLADWAVDFTEAPNASYFCGTGGCRHELFVGKPDGTWKQVFARTSGDLKITGPKSARGVEVNYHGSVCDSFGADECLRAYRWDAGVDGYVEVPNSKGLAMLVGGSLSAMDPALSETPPIVQQAFAEKQKACRAAGGDYAEADAPIQQIPDINGDGVRDWVVGSYYDLCLFENEAPENAPQPSLKVFASQPDGGWVLALDRKSVAWDLDISTAPARILLVDKSDDNDCGYGGKPCPREPLAWDQASQSLKP